MPKTWKSGLLMSSAVSTMILLSGCVFGGEQAVSNVKKEEIDPPQDINYVEDEKQLGLEKENMEEEVAESVTRQLYLLDQNGYVVPQTVELPKTKEVAKQALEYLVNGGPVMEMLPNGFQAVLPTGTEINGLNLKEDGTIIADFSKEFAEYKAEDELKILQAITWTLTQFENVERVQVRINGHEQPFMPVDGTPINEGFSRANGVNLDSGEVIDVMDSKAVTLYFLNQVGDNTYYVPVTRRVDKDLSETNHTAMIVNELIKGPSFSTNLVSEFNPEMQLLDEPKYENGTVTLNFNEAIYNSVEGEIISNNVINPLVLSLTEQEGVEGVAIHVNGEKSILSESGEEVANPVTRPKEVNTVKF